MISFAQNFEDVILARVFRGRSHGRYVDVGAHFPIVDSVTEHFYRLGWRGINIEPLDAAFAELCSVRPGDENLHCAIGAEDGVSRFFELDGFSTLEKSVAAAHEAAGRASREITVETQTLSRVMNRLGGQQIDFLKIDVEGAEVTVLKSNDWQRFRPSIVLVEAIHPVTHAPSHDEWEWVLREAGYNLVHFDGVNRFYWNSALERPDVNCFLPPNALDNITPYPQIAAEARASEAARTAQYERQRSAEIETLASEQSRTGSLLGTKVETLLNTINDSLHAMARNEDADDPNLILQSGYHALRAAQADMQARLEGCRLACEKQRILLESSERRQLALEEAVSIKAVSLADMQARLEGCQSACEEQRVLLELSERRRLAMLESSREPVGEGPSL